MKNSDQFCNVYLKLWFISFKLMPVEMSLWRHPHQHATSRDEYKGTIAMKYFSCIISSELKICAPCKNHVSYFNSVYLHLIETNLYTILLTSKQLKCDKFFVVFDFLMNVKIDFHISHRQTRQVKYSWCFETPLLILDQTSCPIRSVHGTILAYYTYTAAVWSLPIWRKPPYMAPPFMPSRRGSKNPDIYEFWFFAFAKS